MKIIALIPKKFVVIDDEDFDVVSKYPWYLNKGRKTWYARTLPLKMQMHRMILNITDISIEVDHIDGMGWNNRRANLRVCTHEENTRNRRIDKTTNSGYRGVYSNGTNWTARIKYKGEVIHIGTFDTIEEAARARDIKTKELHGSFAVLNFP